MNDARFASLYAITAAKLAEIKATQEIILKAQAHFVATLTQQPWEPIFEDLRTQAAEAARVYREQTLNELNFLLEEKSRAHEEPPPNP